jgi:hypothetical protein
MWTQSSRLSRPAVPLLRWDCRMTPAYDQSEWERIFTREIIHHDDCPFVPGDGGEDCDCYVGRLYAAISAEDDIAREARLVRDVARRGHGYGWARFDKLVRAASPLSVTADQEADDGDL